MLFPNKIFLNNFITSFNIHSIHHFSRHSKSIVFTVLGFKISYLNIKYLVRYAELQIVQGEMFPFSILGTTFK
jgi:hypothetical protein